MPITAEDILNIGNGPVATTFMEPEAQPALTPQEPQKAENPPATDQEQTVGTSTDNDNNANVSSQQGKKLSYVDMYQQMNPFHVMTDAEIEQERKKQKREAIFSAIGDGISAMSNLFFTTQYAPNMYNAAEGLSAKSKERWDKLKKDYNDDKANYLSGYMKAVEMDNIERQWQHTIEREKVADHYKEQADQRAQAKADYDAAMAELNLEIAQNKLSQQEAAAKYAKIKGDYADAYMQSIINKNNRSGSSGSSGGGSQKTSTWTIVNTSTGETKEINASSKANAYSKVPDGWTIKGPTEQSETITQTSGRGKNKQQTKTTTKTTTAQSVGGSGRKTSPTNTQKGKKTSPTNS